MDWIVLKKRHDVNEPSDQPGAIQLTSSRWGVGAHISVGMSYSGVFLLDVAAQEFQRVSDLPARVNSDSSVEMMGVGTQIFMNPQGTGAIFAEYWNEGTLVYLSFEEGRLYDLRSQIDPYTDWFTWLTAPAVAD